MFRYIRNHIADMFRVYCREFYIVFHDYGLIIFFAFLPIAYPVIYSLIYNPEVVRDVPMVVVDHDRTALTREMVRKIDACQEAWVKGYATDLNEARHAMNSQECYAILEIPEGFSKKVGNGEQGNAVMFCEMSLLLRYRGFLVATTNVMQDMGSELLLQKIDEIAPLVETISQGDLLPISNVSLGNIKNGFDSFIMPGVVILILHQCIILASGMAGGARRENPAKVGYIPYNEGRFISSAMVGKILCYMTILLFPIIYIIHYIPLMFSFPMAGNTWEIFAFLLPMVLACFGLAFCVQGVVWERESIFVIWVVTSVIFLFLSGLTWPRYGMSPTWKFISGLVPATWGIEGFIKMNTNGATLSQVADCYRNLWILAALYMVLGYCVQRWVMRPDVLKCSRQYLALDKARRAHAEAVAAGNTGESSVEDTEPVQN